MMHILLISKTEDDYWQVEFIVVDAGNFRHLGRLGDWSEARYRCDGLRGVGSFVRGHLAGKAEEMGRLSVLWGKVTRPWE